MGKIKVHEFMTLDGVIEDPSWTMDSGFDPKMGEAIAGLMSGAKNAILLGRKTYQMFEPAWSTRTAEDDPGAPFFNDTDKYVVSATLDSVGWSNSTLLGRYDPEAMRTLKKSVPDTIYVRQRDSGASAAGGRSRRRAPPFRLSGDAGRRASPVHRRHVGPQARSGRVGDLHQRRRSPRLRSGRHGPMSSAPEFR